MKKYFFALVLLLFAVSCRESTKNFVPDLIPESKIKGEEVAVLTAPPHVPPANY